MKKSVPYLRQIEEFGDVKIEGLKNLGIGELKGSRIRGFKGSSGMIKKRIQGFRDSGIEEFGDLGI